jgi:hypothetical protein
MHDDDILELDGAVITQVAPPDELPALLPESELDALFGEDEETETLSDDDLLDDAPAPPSAPPVRVVQLETAVKQLAEQQATHEQQRVKRKVTAATGGAGLASLVPIGLQLMGALHVTAEVASTVAAVAAAAGALLAGYLTPERQAPASAAELLTP